MYFEYFISSKKAISLITILTIGFYFVFPKEIYCYPIIKIGVTLILLGIVLYHFFCIRTNAKTFLIPILWFLIYGFAALIIALFSRNSTFLNTILNMAFYTLVSISFLCQHSYILEHYLFNLRVLHLLLFVFGPVVGLIQLFILKERFFPSSYYHMYPEGYYGYHRLTTLAEVDANYSMLPLLLLLALSLMLYRLSPGSLSKLMYGCSLVLTIIAILFTFSRGGWIATMFVLGIQLISIVEIRKLRSLTSIVTLSMFLVIALGIAAHFGFADDFLRLGRDSLSTMQIRIELWYSLTSILLQYPIWGTGVSDIRNLVYELSGYYMTVHNLYYQTAIQGGIILLTFLFSMISYIIYNFISAINIKSYADKRIRIIGFSLCSGFFAYLIMVNTISDAIGFYLWLYLAFSIAFKRLVSKHQA